MTASSAKKKDKKEKANKPHPTMAMMALQMRGMQKQVNQLETILTKNTQIFQETISLMDIRQSLLIRKLRISVIGVDWGDLMTEYAMVVALIAFCGHYNGWERRARKTTDTVPEGAVVFGGS